MNVLYSWLKEFIDIDEDPNEIADRLTMAGIETSSVSYLGADFDKIVTARIRSIKKHPKADRLTLCVVTDGDKDYNIVCGAANIKEGDIVPLALAGAKLPAGPSIGRTTIRGEESNGMMCSERELGISDNHEGIMVLDKDIEPGNSIAETLSLDDYLMVMEITPNRGDCLSVYGIAREIAAIYELPLKKPQISVNEHGRSVTEEVSVSIDDFDLCPRYSSRVIYGVRVEESPQWMQRRLKLCGIRPINNIVDITNYLLLELGQPMHAFDLDLVRDGKIVVKKAGNMKHFTTLDGIERNIHEDTLMIWDGKEPVAIAGIMGGENSEVREETTRILFESAHFNPLSVRKSRKRLGISTESSYRFERGVDPSGTVYAIERAITILSRSNPFTVCKGIIDEKKDIEPYRSLQFQTALARRITGMKIEKKAARRVFERLGFSVREERREGMVVDVPSHRFDITRGIDLVEEIARILGYNRVPTTYPKAHSPHRSAGHRFIDFKKKISFLLSYLGVFESIHYSFMSDNLFEKLALYYDDFHEEPVRLKNPISDDTRVLRPSLFPGLLKSINTNLSRYMKDVRLFEIGKVFKKSLLDSFYEENRLGVALTGNIFIDVFSGSEKKIDFYYAKSILQKVLSVLSHDAISIVPDKTPHLFHTHKSAAIKNNHETVGYIGLLNEEVCELFDISREVYYFELRLDPLFIKEAPDKTYRQISKYPPVERDISFLVDQGIITGDILEYVKRVEDTIISDVSIFDVYASPNKAPGKKSLGLRVVYQAHNRTLTEQEVNDIHMKITKLIENRFGGIVRSG